MKNSKFMLKLMFVIIMVFNINKCFTRNMYIGSGVPVHDANLLFDFSDLNNINNLLNNLATDVNIVNQASDLKKLVNFETDISNKCNTSCSPNDLQQLQNYLNTINNNLLSEFSSMDEIYQHATNDLSGIKEFADHIAQLANGGVRIAEVNAKIQQASLSSLRQSEAILVKMHLYELKKQQKEDLQHKIEQINNDNMYRGFHNSGL